MRCRACVRLVLAAVSEDTAARYFVEQARPQYARPVFFHCDNRCPERSAGLAQTRHGAGGNTAFSRGFRFAVRCAYPHDFRQKIRPVVFQRYAWASLIAGSGDRHQVQEGVITLQILGFDPTASGPKWVAQRGHDGTPAADDSYHRSGRGVLESRGNDTGLNVTGLLVESPHYFPDPDRFDRPPVHRRARREALVLNPQPDLGEPRLPGVHANQRVHAGHRDGAVRLNVVPPEFLQVRQSADPREGGRPDDPVAHTFPRHRLTDLRDEFAAVRDGADWPSEQRSDAGQDVGLTRPGRQGVQDVQPSARPELQDRVDCRLLIFSCGVHVDLLVIRAYDTFLSHLFFEEHPVTITITMTFETAEDAAQAMGRLAVQEDFVVSQTVVADDPVASSALEAARVNQDWADSAPLRSADPPTDGNDALFDALFGAGIVVSNLTAEEAGRSHAAIEAALSGPPAQPAEAAVPATGNPENLARRTIKMVGVDEAGSFPVLPAPPATALDANGLPWDARLHAGTKTKNADGTWRALRKPAAPRADVEADLLAGLAARPAAVPPPPGTETFAQYMARIGAMFATNPEKAMVAMSAALAPCGLTHVGQLAGRADLIPEVDARFQAGVTS